MATIKDVTQALYGELTPVVKNTLSVADPDDYVDLYNRHDGATYPFVGIERFGPIPVEEGIGRGMVTVGYLTDSNGVVTDVRKQRKRRVQMDVTVLDDGDHAEGADDLYVAVDDRLSLVSDDYPSAFHADVTEIELVDGADESRGGDGIRGRSIRLQFDYHRYLTKSVTAMETVDVTFEERDSTTDYQQSGSF